MEYDKKQKRLQMTLYRNQYLTDLLEKLSALIAKPFEKTAILDIDETEKLVKLIKKSPIGLSNFSLLFPVSEAANIQLLLASLTAEISGTNYFAIQKFDGKCYMAINTSFVLSQWQQIVTFDGYGFYIYNSTLDNGLWIDYNESNWKGTNGTYEIKVWGKKWISKVYPVFQTI